MFLVSFFSLSFFFTHIYLFRLLAQIVAASNVKNLNPQQLRNVNIGGTQAAAQQQQTLPHIQQQRPRSVPTIATSTINAKQLTTRGLITTQRNIAVASNPAQVKITTPITSKNK